MAEIYRQDNIAASQEFYGDLLVNYSNLSVAQHLNLMADRLFVGYQQKDEVAARETNNYHPDWLGKAPELIFQAYLKLEDMRQTIASQYGFLNWQAVEQQDNTYDRPFEQALDALLNGHVSELQKLLSQHPTLVNQRSSYGHQAQLIHYAGNNGVELWRQQVPLNLPELIQVLLDAGTDKMATMPVYGGHYNTLQLFATSAHPHDTPIRDEVMELLN